MTDPYGIALLDWLACAARGRSERAAVAAARAGDGLLDRVAAAGAAGHVLDYDDTWTPGLVHLSAPTAPAALVLAAEAGATVEVALRAYAAGFEAMAALSRASHPALYDAGRHPTALCGTVGAAVAAGAVLGFGEEAQDAAGALALVGAGGLLAAFGSDAKALQVGMAAATGVQAALLAAGGARPHPPERYAPALGVTWARPGGERAIDSNWIKAYPCCLQTHTAIEAALRARPRDGRVELTVHPLARAAAAVDVPEDGLQAKFSLPYLVAFALERGAPGVDDFAGVGEVDLARVTVAVDPGLGEQEAVLSAGGEEVARVTFALGSPERPMGAEQLAAKVHDLARDRLDAVLDEPERPAGEVLEAAGLA
ncbi:MAG: MmgE/PrpD family protein [Solirubrobacteraceae bacterium]